MDYLRVSDAGEANPRNPKLTSVHNEGIQLRHNGIHYLPNTDCSSRVPIMAAFVKKLFKERRDDFCL